MKETELKELLKQYSMCKRFINSQAYAKEYFNPYNALHIYKKAECEARMREIESFIQALAPSDEYTILHLHYIKGLSVEKCAECMYVSPRTAFRLLKKAHLCLCDFMNKKGADNEQRKAD